MLQVQTIDSPSITQVHENKIDQIKPYKMDPLLKSKAKWRCINPSDISYINKYRPKTLSQLEITRIDFENIETRPLCRAIRDLKRVCSLNFLQKNLNSKDLIPLIHTTNHWKDLGIWSRELNKGVLKTLRIRKCKQLESLAIPSKLNQSIREGAAKDFFRQIKGLRKLKALDVDVNNHNLAIILDSIIHWKSIKKVSLTFLKRVTDYQKLLSKIQHVEKLKLHFDRESNLQVSDAQIWVSFFQRATNLKNLAFTLEVYENRGTEALEAFTECFQHFKQATHLRSHFVLYSRDPLDQTVFFNSFSGNLGALVQLQSLDLKISFSKIRNSHFLSLISALQNLKNLQKLSLYFCPLESPTECVSSLAECLKNLNNIRALVLILRDHEINRKPLEAFFQNIASQSLKSLGLVLGHKSMRLHHVISTYPEIQFRLGKIANLWKGKQDPAVLFSPFSAFKGLLKLSLDLTSCYISVEEFEALAAALKQMNKLSSLALKLPQFDPGSNFEGLQNFLACFKDLNSLLELDLIYLGACVHDQEIALLGLNLKECRGLKSLSLKFPRAAKLNGKSLDVLVFGLQDLRRLKSLCLAFELTKGFEENDVWKFLSRLSCLKDLEVLRFFDAVKVAPYDCLNNAFPVCLKEFESLRHLYEFVLGVRFI